MILGCIVFLSVYYSGDNRTSRRGDDFLQRGRPAAKFNTGVHMDIDSGKIGMGKWNGVSALRRLQLAANDAGHYKYVPRSAVLTVPLPHGDTECIPTRFGWHSDRSQIKDKMFLHTEIDVPEYVAKMQINAPRSDSNNAAEVVEDKTRRSRQQLANARAFNARMANTLQSDVGIWLPPRWSQGEKELRALLCGRTPTTVVDISLAGKHRKDLNRVNANGTPRGNETEMRRRELTPGLGFVGIYAASMGHAVHAFVLKGSTDEQTYRVTAKMNGFDPSAKGMQKSVDICISISIC